ncbi:adhesion G protein-coupled receptor B2 [Trichonephila clavipes]|nr:adhesion G protein-coupled receptor B2 [Trichonephila clavipes]
MIWGGFSSVMSSDSFWTVIRDVLSSGENLGVDIGHLKLPKMTTMGQRYRTLNCNKTTMYYSTDVNFFYSKDNLVALHFKYDFWHMTATAGSDVVQSGRPIFDDFFQHLWLYIGNNTANVVFQMVKRLWLIRIDQ